MMIVLLALYVVSIGPTAGLCHFLDPYTNRWPQAIWTSAYWPLRKISEIVGTDEFFTAYIWWFID